MIYATARLNILGNSLNFKRPIKKNDGANPARRDTNIQPARNAFGWIGDSTSLFISVPQLLIHPSALCMAGGFSIVNSGFAGLGITPLFLF